MCGGVPTIGGCGCTYSICVYSSHFPSLQPSLYTHVDMLCTQLLTPFLSPRSYRDLSLFVCQCSGSSGCGHAESHQEQYRPTKHLLLWKPVAIVTHQQTQTVTTATTSSNLTSCCHSNHKQTSVWHGFSRINILIYFCNMMISRSV